MRWLLVTQAVGSLAIVGFTEREGIEKCQERMLPWLVQLGPLGRL